MRRRRRQPRRQPPAVARTGEPRLRPLSDVLGCRDAVRSIRSSPGARSGDRAPFRPLRPRSGPCACDLDDEPERLLPASTRRSRRRAGLAAPRPGRAQLPPRARALRRPPARTRARPDLGVGEARGVRGLAAAASRLPSRLPAGVGPVAPPLLQLVEGDLGAQLRTDRADALAGSAAGGRPRRP